MDVEAWGGHGDQGRDAYCTRSLTSGTRKVTVAGPVIFQAKFVSEANAAGAKPAKALVDACRFEAKRIGERIKKKEWANSKSYLLYTNAPVGTKTRSAIISILSPVLGYEPTVLGFEDLSAELDLLPHLARSFPQILTYRNLLIGIEEMLTSALANILNADILKRTESVVKKAKEVLEVFVPTTAFENTWLVLSKHHFAVLSGPPEMGKTSISWMVALSQAASGWQVIDCETPDDFFRLHQNGRSQIFLADDAFGRTEYDPSIGKRWGKQLPNILPQLDRQHQLVWTSRRHILERARSEMDLGSTLTFPMPAEVIVNADSLTPREKALVLYRHAVAAGLEQDAKLLLKSNLQAIIADPHFTPLRIYLFCRRSLPKLTAAVAAKTLKKKDVAEAISKAISEVTSEMTKSYRALPLETQWLLAVLLDEDGSRDASAIEKLYTEISPLPLSRPIKEILDELDESFLRIRRPY